MILCRKKTVLTKVQVPKQGRTLLSLHSSLSVPKAFHLRHLTVGHHHDPADEAGGTSSDHTNNDIMFHRDLVPTPAFYLWPIYTRRGGPSCRFAASLPSS